MTQEWHFTQPELTLAEFGIQLVFSQSLEYNSKMFLVLFHILGVDRNVVNEKHNKLIQLSHEHRIHEIQKVCRCVDQSKGHD
jgi:hypothetical protein